MEKNKLKFREITLESGIQIFLGRNAESNDELMKKFKGKENIILHTSSPGSPFGVIESLNLSEENLKSSGAVVASYSQDWRDNKRDVVVDVFTGKDISKPWFAKPGTWKVKKLKKVKIKRIDIMRYQRGKQKK